MHSKSELSKDGLWSPVFETWVVCVYLMGVKKGGGEKLQGSGGSQTSQGLNSYYSLKPQTAYHACLGVSDTHVLLLNEYIVELNPAKFNILIQILN